ncbi:MAG: hypothetical protein LBF72_03000 [Holosporales bacterium]|jgi:hypothetical protein|nr:hypothetical protein [Holosporales bacterium]
MQEVSVSQNMSAAGLLRVLGKDPKKFVVTYRSRELQSNSILSAFGKSFAIHQKELALKKLKIFAEACGELEDDFDGIFASDIDSEKTKSTTWKLQALNADLLFTSMENLHEGRNIYFHLFKNYEEDSSKNEQSIPTVIPPKPSDPSEDPLPIPDAWGFSSTEEKPDFD